MSERMAQDTLISMYTHLSRIRKVSLAIEQKYPQDEMKTPVHLSLGQEAVAVGVCAHLNKDDIIFSNHRSHAHYLAKGGDLKAMIAELYGRETGCSRGRGGSMHLIDTSIGHWGSSAIVGGSIPHAVGAAFAMKYRKAPQVAVSFMGDAATEQGVFYESMSWAKMRELPVVFICENNLYSVCSHISARQPKVDIVARARAFDLPSVRIDGMNVLEVHAKAGEAINHARQGHGPYFIECCVQRWRGHAGGGDPLREQYRRPEECEESYWRDPLKDFRHHLVSEKIADDKKLDDIDRKLGEEINRAFQYAQESPLPRKEDLEKYLYS